MIDAFWFEGKIYFVKPNLFYEFVIYLPLSPYVLFILDDCQ